MNGLRALPYVIIAVIVMGVLAVTFMPAHWLERGEPVTYDINLGGGIDPASQGFLKQGSAKAVEIPSANWAQFGGPNRDYNTPEKTKLLKEWPDSGPQVLWEQDVCIGHAGVAVHKGTIFFTDHDQKITFKDAEGKPLLDDKGEPQVGGDVIRAMNLDTGEDIWRFAYPLKVKSSHGITRPVPAVDDQLVVSLGPILNLVVLDRQTGKRKWSVSLTDTYESKVPMWYGGQCPLLDSEEGTVVVAPSGPEVLMVKYNAEDGEIIWEASNSLGSEMTHTSHVPMTLEDGTKCYLYFGSKGLHGIKADDGEVLFDDMHFKINTAACASPVPLPGDRVFVSAGYGVGCMMLQIEKDDSPAADTPYKVKPLWSYKEKHFGSTHHTPIFHDGAIWGMRPNGHFVCMNPEDGSFFWESPKEYLRGMGPYVMAKEQGIMYILEGHGRLDMVAIDKSGFNRLASHQVWAKGKDAWGPMALAGGRLIFRDFKRMMCVKVGE